MRRFLIAVVACGLLGGVARAADADTLVADQIKHLNALADALDKKDQAGARNAVGLVLENRVRLAELKLSDADKQKLSDKYQAALDKANTRVEKAMGQLDLGLGELLGGGRGDAEMKEIIKLMEEMIPLKKAAEKDPAKATELLTFLPKIAAVSKKLEELKLTPVEQKRLEQKYKAQLEKLQQQLNEPGAKDKSKADK
jgi:hypothetical protein